jgi:hypothetical protein
VTDTIVKAILPSPQGSGTSLDEALSQRLLVALGVEVPVGQLVAEFRDRQLTDLSLPLLLFRRLRALGSGARSLLVGELPVILDDQVPPATRQQERTVLIRELLAPVNLHRHQSGPSHATRTPLLAYCVGGT